MAHCFFKAFFVAASFGTAVFFLAAEVGFCSGWQSRPLTRAGSNLPSGAGKDAGWAGKR